MFELYQLAWTQVRFCIYKDDSKADHVKNKTSIIFDSKILSPNYQLVKLLISGFSNPKIEAALKT